MNKTKLIAISGLCTAVVVGCLLLATLPIMRWAMLILGVVAALATVIPTMLDTKNLVWTLLIYIAGSALGVFFGLANLVYVAPIVSFCIPFAIVKVYGEKIKLTATVRSENVLDDPFDDEVKVVKVQVKPKTNLGKTVRWLLYYAILEAALALTVLCAYLTFSSDAFQALTNNVWFWVVLAAMQFAVFPYDLLLRGALVATNKALRKAIKP